MSVSKQPRFIFSNDADEQKEQLKTNVLMEQFSRYRAEHKENLFYPAYHFWAPDGVINAPNGLCYRNGKYHLFYQQCPPVDPVQHWGHAISDDMVHWKDLPTAIYPDIESACFNGNCLVDDDRVIAMYHGHEIGNMIATSSDPLLLNWEKNPNNPVIPHPDNMNTINPSYRVYDPFIWKEDDGYYSLSGSMSSNGIMAEYLFFSQNLDKWTYIGPLMDSNPFVEAPNDGSCPYFLPFGENKNQRILFFFSHLTGTRALIGTYDKVIHKFTPQKSIIFSYDSVDCSSLTAPCAISDGNGGIYVIYNMSDSVWDRDRRGVLSLMRHITTDAERNVWVKPAEELESLRRKTILEDSIPLNAGEKNTLRARGKCIEINAEIDIKKARTIEFKVLCDDDSREYTTISFIDGRMAAGQTEFFITINTSHSSLAEDVTGRIPVSTSFWHDEENIKENINVRIFVDKCMVEVFVNDKVALCQLAYATLPESDGITVEALGGDAVIENIKVFELGSIF